MPEAKPAALDITLRPHRSLSGVGLRVVLGAVLLSNLMVAALFWALKAWPVFGFLGLDVALVFWAFVHYDRKARAHEQIVIAGDEVTFTRSNAKGEIKRSFNRRWLRVHLEFDQARELVGRLFLISHGKRTEVGSFLGADERQALADVLHSALIRPKL